MLTKIGITFALVNIVISQTILPEAAVTTDVWGDFGDSFQSTVAPLKGNDLGKLNPNETLTYDKNNEDTVYGYTDNLVDILGKCQEIVVAAYKVANYTPDLHNSPHAAFWRQEVIPNLVGSLNQDVKARHVIINSISTIADLSMTIQKASEIVIQSKGSKKARQIAQKNIPAALAELNKAIAEASGLDNIALKSFSNQTTHLLEIIGPNAANFVEQYSSYKKQLDELHKIQEDVFIKLAKKQGEAAKYSAMMSSIEKRLHGTEQEVAETKKRMDQLKNMNNDVETTIKNIPDTVQKQIITHSSGGWWLWRHHEEHVSTIQIKNPDKDVDTAYYNRVIKAREDRIKSISNEKDAKQKIQDALNDDLTSFNKSYIQAVKEINAINKELSEVLNSTQNRIDMIMAQMKTIDKTEKKVNGMTGLSGETLINCLASVKAFAQSLERGTTVYSPLVAILKAINAMIQSNVELLDSDETTDIYLSVNNLLKQVKFLSTYSVSAKSVLKATTQYSVLLNQFVTEPKQMKYLTLN